MAEISEMPMFLTSAAYYDAKSALTLCNCSCLISLQDGLIFYRTLCSEAVVRQRIFFHKYLAHLHHALLRLLQRLHESGHRDMIYLIFFVFLLHCLFHVCHGQFLQNIRRFFVTVQHIFLMHKISGPFFGKFSCLYSSCRSFASSSALSVSMRKDLTKVSLPLICHADNRREIKCSSLSRKS